MLTGVCALPTYTMLLRVASYLHRSPHYALVTPVGQAYLWITGVHHVPLCGIDHGAGGLAAVSLQAWSSLLQVYAV